MKTVTFMPISNAKGRKGVAYIVAYGESQNIANIEQNYLILNAIIFTGLIVLFFLIYTSLKQKNLLFKSQSDLLRERNLFITGPTVIFKWKAKEGWPVEYVSANIKEQFGYSVEELKSGATSFIDIIFHKDLERVSKEVVDFTKEGVDTFTQEYRLVNKEGCVRWISDLTHIVRDKTGLVTHYDGYIIDISEKKKLHAEKEEMDRQLLSQSKLALLGEMSAGVGHEINNPLAVSVGNITIIEKILSSEKNFNEKILKSINSIKMANERIRKIVNGLRVYARSDTSHNEIISIRKVIIDTIDLLSAIYEKEGVRIINNFCNTECTKQQIADDYCCTCAPIYISGNMGKLQQIILNLISNAKDATEGQTERNITLTLTESPNEMLNLSVTDNGTGIPDSIKDKILNPFFTTKDVGKGTGMGLGITNEFLQVMNGTLSIQSKVNEGSTFTITLPKVAKENIPIPKKINKKPRTQLKGLVLVVDDEPEIREILADYLEEMGLVVDEADDGDTALEKVKLKKYDFICTDMKMPRMNGDKFIKEAKKLPFGNTKYIVITGGVATTFSEERRKQLWEIADSYIIKPFTEESLYEALTKEVKS